MGSVILIGSDRMIQFKNVSKIYIDKDRATIGLKNINIDINEMGIVAILGESGSGKSTFLKLLAKLDSPTEGEIIIDGKNTSEYDLDEMTSYRFQNISFIYQDYHLVETMSVLDNVMMPLLIRNYSYKEAKELAKKAIFDVGLDKLIHKRCNKLSGGEAQRCAIARALVTNTKIIACDEPTANLDSKNASEIIKLLAKLGKDRLVLIITHNFHELEEVADRRIVFKNNEIILDEKINVVESASNLRKECESITFKNLIKMSFLNLFKNLSNALFILVASLLFVSLMVITFTAENISLNQYKYTNRFVNVKENSVYVLANKDKPLDIAYFEGYESYNINPSEELKDTYYEIKDLKNMDLYYSSERPSLLIGRYPSDANEVCINLEGNLTSYECQAYLNRSISNYKMGEEFTIVGVASSAKKSYLFGNDYLMTLAKLINSDIKVCINYDGKLEALNSQTSTTRVYDYSTILCGDIEKNKITFPKEMEGFITRVDIYYETDDDYHLSNTDDFIIEYDGEETILEVGMDYMFDCVYDAIIYNVDTNKEISYWNSLGYYAVDMKYYSCDLEFIDNASIYASIGLIYAIIVTSIVIFSFIFVTLFKLSNKKYLVLNSLGMNKTKIKQLISLEVIWHISIATIIALVVSVIVLNVYYIDLSIIGICTKSIISIIVFLCFTVLVLNRFVLSKKKDFSKGGKRND